MGRWGRAAAALGVAWGLWSCSQDGESVPSELGAYVAAVEAGDFDALMAARCAVGREDRADAQRFLADVEQVRDSLGGSIEVAMVRREEPVTVGSMRGSAGDQQFEVTFQGQVDGSVSSPIHLVTVVEDGHDVVCGYRTDESIHAPFDGPVALQPTPGARLTEVARVADVDGPADGSRIEDGPADLALRPGALEGWSVVWRLPSSGGARITAIRLPDAQTASEAASAFAQLRANDGVERFDVPGLVGAAGIRYAAASWTWIQPGSAGPLGDAVIAALADTVVVVEVSGLSAAADHERIDELTEQVVSQLT